MGLQDYIIGMLGGSIDSLGEFIVFFLLVTVFVALILVALLIFGFFSSSMGLLLIFRKNKKLGIGFLLIFIACIILAFRSFYEPIIILGIASLIYSAYSFIKWLMKRLKKSF